MSSEDGVRAQPPQAMEDEGAEGLSARLSAGSASEACEALVTGAYEAGGRDNITAVVLRVAGV
jgi:serine/threonine protein phosphatase PrpC